MKLRKLFAALACWLPGVFICAQRAEFAPSAIPDRIILTWSDDPATTQAVTWRTDTTVTEAWAELAPADASPDFPRRARAVPAATEKTTTPTQVAHAHSVTFTALEPNTLYAYRVGSEGRWSEWLHFRTADRRQAPFSFLYFGDAQNDIKSLWSRCIRQAITDNPDIDFLLHAGDLVDRGDSDAEWGEWFYAGGWIYGMKPNLATPGNHEYSRDTTGRRRLSPLWRPTFTFPLNGPPGLEETVYYIDYQGVRFISLNTQAMLLDPAILRQQKAWLDTVLTDNPYRWTIVTHHHPVYSTTEGRDNAEVRRAFQPLYEKYGVDLVLQGHDHTYGRGHNLKSGRRKKDQGPVYVVSVSGPKMYDLSFDRWLERVGSNTQLYQVVRIDGDRLYYQAYTATGELYDAFELRKRANHLNRFYDRTPKDLPEIVDLPARAASKMSEEEVEQYRRRFQKYMERKDKRR